MNLIDGAVKINFKVENSPPDNFILTKCYWHDNRELLQYTVWSDIKNRWPFFFVIAFCLLFMFGFFFHIQEGTILFMWVEGEGVQRVNSTCILKRNNKEGWQKVVQQMWVSEILQSSFAFVCLFLLLSNNLLASRSQAFRLFRFYYLPRNVKDIFDKIRHCSCFQCTTIMQWVWKMRTENF